jgi:hypothetical protein
MRVSGVQIYRNLSDGRATLAPDAEGADADESAAVDRSAAETLDEGEFREAKVEDAPEPEQTQAYAEPADPV